MGKGKMSKILGIAESLNTYHLTNLSFKMTQFIRMIIFLALVGIFFINVYIFVKLTMFYPTSWSLMSSILAIMYVALGAGRTVVEKKMLIRN